MEHVSFEIHPEYQPAGDEVEGRFPGYGQLIERLKIQGADFGCKFEKVSILSNTYKAMLVGELAKELGKSNEYINGMFIAYFHDGKNIGEIDIIKEVAESVGISSDEVEDALVNKKYIETLNNNKYEGYEMGINSVPTFIINDKYVLVGAQPPKEFEKIMNKIINED